MHPGTVAESAPDRAAVIMADTGETVTFAELDERSTRVARMLQARGLRPGDVIALLSENNARCFEIYWAGLRSGLNVTAINHHLSAGEVAYIIDDSDAKALFSSAHLKDLAEQVLDSTPQVEVRYSFDGAIDGHESYENSLEATSGERLTDQPAGAPMLYSSGTTGRPKGVKVAVPPVQVGEPGADVLAPLVLHGFGLGEGEIYLSPAPLYHGAPLRWSATIQSLGGTVVVMDKFDPEKFLEFVERYKVTVAQLVPTMFVRMLKLPPTIRETYSRSTLKMAIHAAAPCPVEVKEEMLNWWGPIVWEYYASTEANGFTMISPSDWLKKPGSVGRAAMGTLHICDDSGEEVPTGENGVVYFERDFLPFEYYKDPEKTKAAQHPDHPTWTFVGDIGYVDDDGYLFLTDRKSFMIISGGVNIYPQEIEDVLTLHPAILDVAIIGVPDAEMGESVKAVVELAEGIEPSAELETELIDYVRERIAHYKAPRSVDFVDELPRTPTGKLVKRTLRDLYVS